MRKERFGFKELYEVQLKATSSMRIGERDVSPGEPIVVFDSIQISTIREHTDRKHARGGYGNEAHVMWEQNRRVDLSFTQGVFSPTHLALLANANIIENQDFIPIPKIETFELNETLEIELEQDPFSPETIFVYHEKGKKIKDFEVVGKKVSFPTLTSLDRVSIHYDMIYRDSNLSLILGSKLITNFVELSGKTRLRDDKTGMESTAVICFPRVQLTSDLFLRLGRDASPIQGEFLAQAFPVGPKGREQVGKIIILSTDIDNKWR